MRIWFRAYTGAKLIRQETIEDFTEDTRTHKVMNSLDAVCKSWDLAKPYWLKNNEREFIERAKTRFTKDNFMEELPFDFLEIAILEEDF